MAGTFDFAEIHVFLLLAEELHFGRTADRAGLSQARVSQLVRRLETRLGARLVDRTNHTSTLTASGLRFLEEVAAPFGALHEVFERAQAARTAPAVLRLGMVPQSSAGGPGLVDIVSTFVAAGFGRAVRIVDLALSDVLGPLQRHEVDLVCIRVPVGAPGLVIGPILTCEPRVLLVAKDHPLAGRRRVGLEVLADHPLADVRGLPPALAEDLLPSLTPSGRPIPRGPRVETMSELMMAVARGVVVHPTAESTPRHRAHPGVVAVPLEDAPPTRGALISRAGERAWEVREFLRLAERVVAARESLDKQD